MNRELHERAKPADVSPDRDRMPAGGVTMIAVIMAAAFVMILNETILATALPSLMRGLDIGAGTAQWVTTGFVLVMAIVTPASGFVLQRWRTRVVFVASVGSFVAGTLLALAAPGFGVLLVARIIQALGTAVMLPLLTTTVMQLVPAARRGRYLGLVTVVMGTSPAIGPPLSGLIVDGLGWRGIFMMLLPIGVLALAVGAVKLRDQNTPTSVPIDGWSVLAAALAFGGLVYGINAIGEGHAVLPLWIPILLGAVALAVFVARQLHRQRRDQTPLLDLRPLGRAPFALGAVVVAAAVLAQAGTMALLPLYLQGALGLDSRTAGLLMLPGGLLMAALSLPIGRLYDRYGPRPLVIPGTVAISVSLWAFGLAATHTPSPLVIVALYLVINIGIAATLPPTMSTALGTLPRSQYEHGSATLSTLQPLAAAVAVALFIGIMSNTQATQLAQGVTAAVASAAGTQQAFLIGGAVTLAGLLAAVFLRRPDTHQATPASTEPGHSNPVESQAP